MKNLFLLVFSLFFTFQLALAQGTGSGGSTGGGLITMRDVRAAALRSRCVDGNVSAITVRNEIGIYIDYRVCKDGTYMTEEEKMAYIRVPGKNSKCRDGWRSVDTINRGGETVRIVRICKGGFWKVEGDY